MATILALKRRILVAQNVSKTTRAMQMIAASKLKRAQNAATLGRPYVEKLTQVSQNIAARVDKDNLHAYMRKNRNLDKTLLVIISPDKGLCGALVSNLLRALYEFKTKDTFFITVGKKAELRAAKSGSPLIASFPFGTSLPSFDTVFPILEIIDEYFLSNKVTNVEILSTKFNSVFSQKATISKLLPITLQDEEKKSPTSPMLFEPNIAQLLPTLLRHFLEMSIYQNILEAYASEQGARMIAMKNATDNAQELVSELKLEYNKSRQEKITNEILDIGGATIALST